jgi:hypothetical protein
MPDMLGVADEVRQFPASHQELQNRIQELQWQRKQEIIAIVPVELKVVTDGSLKVVKYLIFTRNARSR